MADHVLVALLKAIEPPVRPEAKQKNVQLFEEMMSAFQKVLPEKQGRGKTKLITEIKASTIHKLFTEKLKGLLSAGELQTITLDALKTLTYQDLETIQKILLEQYRKLILSEKPDLQGLRQAMDDLEKKLPNAPQAPITDDETRQLGQFIERLKKFVRYQEDTALLEKELSDKNAEYQALPDKETDEAKSKLASKQASEEKITQRKAKIKEIEDKIAQNEQNNPNKKSIPLLLEEKTALLDKLKLDQLTQKTRQEYEELKKTLQKIEDLITELENASLDTSKHAKERYQAAMEDFKKQKFTDEALTAAVKEAIPVPCVIPLSKNKSGETANMVMLVSKEFPGWSFDKCFNNDEALKRLPNAVSNHTNDLQFLTKAQAAAHVPVRLEKAESGDESTAECIVASKTFAGVKVVITQAAENACVQLRTDLTKPDGSSVFTTPADKQKSLNEIALIQAKMLLDNYKPGYEVIAIRLKDRLLAEKVHAALLLMIEDSPAKGCSIENMNLDCNIPDFPPPGLLAKLKGDPKKPWIQYQLGADIYEKYKKRYQPDMRRFSEQMKEEFSKYPNRDFIKEGYMEHEGEPLPSAPSTRRP